MSCNWQSWSSYLAMMSQITCGSISISHNENFIHFVNSIYLLFSKCAVNLLFFLMICQNWVWRIHLTKFCFIQLCICVSILYISNGVAITEMFQDDSFPGNFLLTYHFNFCPTHLVSGLSIYISLRPWNLNIARVPGLLSQVVAKHYEMSVPV